MAERTKIWIADKMKELMKTKPLDKIRVTEICRVAEIERLTFYYHFKDKYDLVAWIFLSDAYDTDVISAESSAQAMAKMRQEFIFYKRAYDDVSQNALWQYMLEYFVKRYELIAKEKLNTEVLDTQLKYSIRLYCYGCVGMTKEWLLNDNTTSAETVVQMIFASMPENMKEILIMKEIFDLQSESDNEIKTVSALLGLWRLIYETSAPARQVSSQSTTSLTRSRLQMILQYIHTNYARQITLDELAAVVSLSKSSVLELFKQYLHTSPVSYLIEYRLKCAARLLSDTEKSVSAIATDTGFENIGYFCRKFKSLFGMTPSEYRKN